ncbi:MAG: cyanophycinase [Chitinophagaceae bacterium]|nr:cyanophycinase [Chitinophagaceae bacterium]
MKKPVVKISRSYAAVRFILIFIFLSASRCFAGTPGSLGLKGDAGDVHTKHQPGIVLIGGGGNVTGAFEWMIKRSGGGDVIVLTASGNAGYNDDIFALGGINSVETLNIASRELADNDTVAQTVRNAEMLFIAGGDQSRYMRCWKNTKLNAAINYLLNEKKVPVGGTSAGCAILTGFYYSGENGSAVSDSVLNNPFHPTVTIYNNDFLHAPWLKTVLSDQHYSERTREGRHVAFMARIIADHSVFPKGIAPDERTAVCINGNGMATVIGEGKAYFILSRSKPEQCIAGKPLEWNMYKKALQVYEIPGTPAGSGHFSIVDFDEKKATGGSWHWWWVEKGILFRR